LGSTRVPGSISQKTVSSSPNPSSSTDDSSTRCEERSPGPRSRVEETKLETTQWRFAHSNELSDLWKRCVGRRGHLWGHSVRPDFIGTRGDATACAGIHAFGERRERHSVLRSVCTLRACNNDAISQGTLRPRLGPAGGPSQERIRAVERRFGEALSSVRNSCTATRVLG
jgi:hypothetical protein